MKIEEFCNTELKEFSQYDNVRSIPSLIDGFKDSQRKAIFGAIKNGNNEIRISQLAGYAALVTAYDHGETSMAGTLIGLAQNYPGSNNVNLLEPIGQFGSILNSKSASPRYIYTKPSKLLREYLKTDDECILEHRIDEEDGKETEPKYYLPILPMWIVNGATGIGTGHACDILPRSPESVKKVIRSLINERNISKMNELLKPHYLGWNGEVVELEDGKYEFHGALDVLNTTTLRVTELPVGYGIDKFKSILVGLIDDSDSGVRDFDNNSTEKGFSFDIKVTREFSRQSIDEIKKKLKLITRMTENVTLWDADGVLHRYDTVYEALKDFVEYRLGPYEHRRLKHIEMLTDEVDFLRQKKLFILEWNSLDNPGKKKLSDLRAHMVAKGVAESNLDRLFALRISSLSLDLITELEKDITEKQGKIDVLQSTTAKDLYLADL